MKKDNGKKGLNASSLDLYDHLFDEACDEVNLDFVADPFCGSLWREIAKTEDPEEKRNNAKL